MANGTATAGNWSGGNAGFQVDYQSTDANGVQTYDVISPDNGYGVQTLRVLQPTHPAAGVAHNFLFVLPVEAGLGNTYGDGLETLQALDAEDQYNLTIVEPTFATNRGTRTTPTTRISSMRRSWPTSWCPGWRQNLSTTGTEQNWLIGFSKSGYGGQDLLLKHPNLFTVAASWDFPADMSSYDQFAPLRRELRHRGEFRRELPADPPFVAAREAPFQTQNRIWMGYSLYAPDMSDYDALLTSLGVAHTPGPSEFAHRWDSGWMPAAVAALYQDSLSLPPGTLVPPSPTCAR